MAELVNICARAVSAGGTLAKDIKAGDVIGTSAGKLKVGEVGRLQSEDGTPMIRLMFPGFVGFPSYSAVIPESADVAIERGEATDRG